MRINVYAEELTSETATVVKTVEGKKFYGVRLFLKSPDSLHFNDMDDDRSAITFWVPYYNGRNHHEDLRAAIYALSNQAIKAARDDQTDGN